MTTRLYRFLVSTRGAAGRTLRAAAAVARPRLRASLFTLLVMATAISTFLYWQNLNPVKSSLTRRIAVHPVFSDSLPPRAIAGYTVDIKATIDDRGILREVVHLQARVPSDPSILSECRVSWSERPALRVRDLIPLTAEVEGIEGAKLPQVSPAHLRPLFCSVTDDSGVVVATPTVAPSYGMLGDLGATGAHKELGVRLMHESSLGHEGSWYDVRLCLGIPEGQRIPFSSWRRGEYLIEYVVDATPVLIGEWGKHRALLLAKLAEYSDITGTVDVPGQLLSVHPQTSAREVEASRVAFNFRDLKSGFDPLQTLSSFDRVTWGKGFEGTVYLKFAHDRIRIVHSLPLILSLLGVLLGLGVGVRLRWWLP
ncbi:MAG: hypothetical protein KAY32_15655 [Candidatus Eisenbacteria sp.]|nr:hypothetical protein [Candidatus Eisenbacteria bacterium]